MEMKGSFAVTFDLPKDSNSIKNGLLMQALMNSVAQVLASEGVKEKYFSMSVSMGTFQIHNVEYESMGGPLEWK